MAVPEQIPVVNYVADGVVKKFDVPFEYDQQSDLHVYVDGAEPTIDKYFFADNAFNFYIAPISGQDVKIKRITPKERDTDYNLHTNTVRPKALNTDFDRLWYVLQEVFSDVGGLSQTVQDEIIARIQGDEDLLNQLTAEISARMLGDEAVTEDLKNYVNQVIGAIINDPDFDGIDADKVNDASGETQQQVNYNGGSKWHSRVGGYKLNERVVLANGNIVKSTINGNTNNPNVDMAGWVRVNDASQIIFGNLDQAKVNYDLFNTPELYGADASAADNTAALQAWLDSGKVLHIRPFKIYKFSGTLTLTVVDQTIIGLTHQKYGNARLLYTGTGTAISAQNNVGYFSPKSWSLVCQVTEEGAVYKPSTVGIDIPSGTTIEAFDWSLIGFERLYSGAGTSYYNKFYFCRFSSFNEGFYNIASYNNNYVGCRWEKFTKALRVLGGSGPLNIDHCSFERFNGNIIDSFSSKCLVNFTNNYVEIMDNEELPLHYTQASNQTKGRFWGGNVLFSGLFASLNINKNQLSMAGVFRVGNFTECDALDSSGNIVSLYITGNNLDRLFQNAGQYTSFNVNDVIYGNLGADGGYTRTYARSAISLKNVRNKYFYYDCILNKVQPLLGRLAIITPANGWSANAANEPNVGAIALDNGSTFLGGALYGTVKTSNVALTVPTSHRPIELGVTQASCVLRAINIVDGTNVLFKYTYSNGELELMVTTPAATLGNVLLNVVIPPRR